MSTKLLLAGPPLLLILGVFIVFAAEPPRVLPRLDLAPSFQLTDPAGQPVSGDNLLGSMVLYSFVGARCDTSCASTLDLLRTLEPETMRGRTVPVRLVTIIAEPADLEQIRAIASVARPSSGNWLVLGGDDTAVRLARQGFRVPVLAGGTGASSIEPTLVLVDPAGIVRAVYRAPLPASSAVKDDLAVLERELASARGPKRLLYEGLHLFTCRVP
ncbi:SCO family protein [Thermomicrobiaceae bacterium CFH 74404]|uniref:SCO family protein n=1 Tax=Thermalbibacter longus TaxID=2951981 RepID=A0AA41WDX2_9BACT|nr:SCO family protein [Thermalbibacter longus]MCM8750262.1 SCO family protein [Thermalbibacter longus]